MADRRHFGDLSVPGAVPHWFHHRRELGTKPRVVALGGYSGKPGSRGRVSIELGKERVEAHGGPRGNAGRTGDHGGHRRKSDCIRAWRDMIASRRRGADACMRAISLARPQLNGGR